MNIVFRFIRCLWRRWRGIWRDSSFKTYSGHNKNDVWTHQRRTRKGKTEITGPVKKQRM